MILQKNIFCYLLPLFFFISFLNISNSRKWSIEDLVQSITEWNYLNDPEELISDKKLGPKIHTSFLKINHVYEKTDVNLFYISDVIDKYVYKRRQFVDDLYYAMLNSTTITNSTMKKHHLLIVVFKKYDELILFGSSPELKKLLPAEKVLNIEMEIKKAMKNKDNSPAAIVYLIFDKLQRMWKKYSINAQGNKKGAKSGNAFVTIKDIIYIFGSVGILSLFFYIFCCRKTSRGKSKRD